MSYHLAESAFMCMEAGRPIDEQGQDQLETFFMGRPEIRLLVEDLPPREANNVKWRILDALASPEGFTQDWEDELHLFFRSNNVPYPIEFYMNHAHEQWDPWVLHDEAPQPYLKRQREPEQLTNETPRRYLKRIRCT